MDATFLPALAALAGSLVGGLTSVAGSWVSQFVQLRAQQQMRDWTAREELYREFIEEASRLYVDAIEHKEARVSNLIELYALVSRMRVRSSPEIVASAETVTRAIVTTYAAPNRSFRDLGELLDSHGEIDPLREFANACRDELHAHQAHRPPPAAAPARPLGGGADPGEPRTDRPPRP